MIHLMLNDLRRPAGVGFQPCLHCDSLILHFDGFIPLALAGTSEKRQTALFGVIRTILLNDFGIEHHGVYRSSSAFIEKRNNAFFSRRSYSPPCRHRFPCAPSMCRAGFTQQVNLLLLRPPTSRRGKSDRASVLLSYHFS